MSFQQFTFPQVQHDLGLTLHDAHLFDAASPFPVREQFAEFLRDGVALAVANSTEKAKSEFIIAPVLLELRRTMGERFFLFSGVEWEADAARGLNGYCDFILSAAAERLEIVAPIFCLVEAKNDNINKGLAQCGAEMYAALIFNQQKGQPREVMYGCVTNAFAWCFLKLENNILYIDPNYVPLTFAEPHRVLAVLQWILDESLK